MTDPKFFIDWYDRHWIKFLIGLLVLSGMAGLISPWLIVPIQLANISLGIAAHISIKRRSQYRYGENK